jgi:hypothetical protein
MAKGGIEPPRQHIPLPTEVSGRSGECRCREGAGILSRRALAGQGRSGSVGNIVAGGIGWLLVGSAYAQTDEIQVYDADINTPGQFSLQLHNNYTPIGRKLPDFEGGVKSNHTLNGVPEWAFGVLA